MYLASKIIFGISVFIAIYFGVVLLAKLIRGHTLQPFPISFFALGMTGVILFICKIY